MKSPVSQARLITVFADRPSVWMDQFAICDKCGCESPYEPVVLHAVDAAKRCVAGCGSGWWRSDQPIPAGIEWHVHTALQPARWMWIHYDRGETRQTTTYCPKCRPIDGVRL